MTDPINLLAALTWRLPTQVYTTTNCMLDGREVPCDPIWSMLNALGGVGSWVFLALFILGVFACIFWIWMLVDAIRRDIELKPVWILILLLSGIIGAVIYYFAVRRPKARRRGR
jgi:hypothetical protein